MRTTLTIDADTEALLREEVARTGLSFKEILNQSVRKALAPRPEKIQIKALFPAPFPVSLTDQSFNQLADQWDDENTVQELNS